MRFHQQQEDSKLPVVDLIPMLNVMMGILAFFVMITMTLSAERVMDVQLPPKSDEDAETEITPEQLRNLFIVQIDAERQISLNREPIDKASLEQRMADFLEAEDNRTVYILSDQDLPYEEVLTFLAEMKQVGGDRVSLAIEASEEDSGSGE
ncbi:MAG: biopolymer transporter ExbD, partial [Cyanobacteria bacterium P01_C01_bin.73]